jgi:hypothetical protein
MPTHEALHNLRYYTGDYSLGIILLDDFTRAILQAIASSLIFMIMEVVVEVEAFLWYPFSKVIFVHHLSMETLF